MKKLIPICVLILASSFASTQNAVAAPTFTIQNEVHNCNGLSNGSFDIVVTAVTGGTTLTIEVWVLGEADPFINQTIAMPAFPYTLSVTSLASSDYVIRVRTNGGPAPLASTKTSFIGDFTVDLVSTTNNSEPTCTTPSGAIDVTTSGFSPAGPIIYTWTGPGGPYNTEDLTGLRGGDYSLSYTDGTTTCTLGPIHIDDPVITPFTISSPDVSLCPGDDLIVNVSVSDIGVTYEALEVNTVLATGAGSGGLLAITVPGLAVGNHTIRVRAYQGTCTGIYNNSPNLDVVVNPTPAAPTVTSPVNYCHLATAVPLTATGSNLLWYTAAVGGVGSSTAPTPSTSAVGTTSYFVSQTLLGCESPRAQIDVNVIALPAAPTVSSPVTYCQNDTAIPLTATGSNLLWYTVASGGVGSAIAPTPSTTTAGTTSYYVSQTVNGCEGPRANINVVVNPTPAAPGVTSPVTYCQGAASVQLTATGSNLLWYTVASGGVGSGTAPTPSTASPGTTSYYVSQTSLGCEGPRAQIDVVVNPTPAAPAVTTPVNYCHNATAVPLTATGSNLLWYTVAVGGVGSSTAPTPSTSSVGTTSYYVSQSLLGCESPRAQIDVNVIALPAAPTVTTPVTYCQNDSAVPLTATGSNLLWYTVASGGTGSAIAPTPSTTAAGTTSYYVSQTVNGCEGPRANINVVVNPTPAAPGVTSPVNYCHNATAIPLTATGSNLLWYTVPSGGAGSGTAPTPLTTSVGTTSYYVSQTLLGCEGPRAQIDVIVNPIPAAPTVSTPVTYCHNASSAPLTATGSNLLWYTAAVGGVGSSTAPTPSTGTVGTTSYYVSQTLLGCESPRAQIDVDIIALPAAPGVTTPVTYCQNDAAAQLTATGTNLLWYTVAVGGSGTATAPTPSTTASGTTSYYVSQTVNNCEGPRAQIEVVVNPTPALPGVTSPVTYCQNDPAAQLTATGSNLLWYTTSSGGVGSGTAPTPLTTAPGTTSYYVSQTLLGCEGPRAQIDVVVNPTPALPGVTTPVAYCHNATAVPLTATGSNLLWYTVAVGGVGSSTAPTPLTGTVGTTSYYVSQTLLGCEGPRAQIDVDVIALPAAPGVTSPVTYCQNDAATQLTATGTNLLWYTVAVGGTGSATAPTPSTTAAGTTTYYVSQTVTGCEGPRSQIDVVVNSTPSLPGVTSPVTYCQNDAATQLAATGSNLLWYTVASGGVGSGTAPTPVTTSAGTTSYFVSQTLLGCEGPRAQIDVVVNPTPAVPTVSSPVNYCHNATAVPLTATGSNLLWYTVAVGGVGSSTAPTPLTGTVGTTSYYVSQTLLGCEGPRAQIDVNVIALPAAPTVTSPVTYCQNDAAGALTATGSNLLWYTVAVGGAGVAVAPTPSTTAAGTTSYYVSQTVGGCEGPRAQIDVVVNPQPIAPAVTFAPSALCVGDVINAPTITAPVGGSTYSWYSDIALTSLITTGTSPSNATLGFSSAAPNTTTVYVRETNSFTCNGPATAVTLTVNAIPVLVTGQTKTICSGSNVGFEILLNPANQPPGTTFSWPDPDGAGPATAGANVPMGSAGTIHINDVLVNSSAPLTVTYVVTASVSVCSSSVENINIIVEASPTASAGSDNTVCSGLVYPLAGASVGGAAATGAWSIVTSPGGGDGVLSSTAQVAAPSSVTFSATVAGSYTLRLTTDDPAGTCVSVTDDVIITITPVPVVLPGQTKTVCGEVDMEILLSPLNQPANTVFNWPDPDGAGPASAGVNVAMGAAGTLHITDVLSNPTLADVTVTYQVTPSVGSCQGVQENIVVTVRTGPDLVSPQTKTICSGDNVNYEILISPANTPAGVKFSWPDPDGTGSGTSQLNVLADPAGTAHITDVLYNGTGAPIHVIYSIIAESPSGCRGVPRDIDITVNPGAVVEAGPGQSICATGTATLAGSSIGGLATVGTWSIAAAPAGGDGALSVTTATATPSSVTFTATIPGNYTLRLTTDDPAGSCVSVIDEVVITVRTLNDPACAGIIIGTGDCTTVVITPKPSPATCSNSDGSIIFTIKPFIPAVLTTEVRIDIIGISPSNNTVARTVHNDSTFNNLPVGVYDYTIEYGDPSCIKTGQVTIDRSGTVGVPTFSNPVDPVCFGPPSGSVTINVAGETGNPLQWSVDGTNWSTFIAGNTVTSIPGGTNIISVRKNSSDPCASGATITLATPTQITTTLTSSNATCANNDGSITLTAVTGGTGPYSFTLNGTAVVIPPTNMLGGLTAATYNLIVTDALGCNRTFTTSISFPGYVAHTVPVIADPDCNGGGTNGLISLQITSSGSYQFGITTDPIAEPATYNSVGGNQITVNNLANGVYAIWIKPLGTGTQCATKIDDLGVSGVYSVNFLSTYTDVVCLSDQGTIQLTDISGAPSTGFTYSLTNTSNNAVTTGSITASQALAPFTITNINPGSYSLRVLQDQSALVACTAPISSQPVNFQVDGPTAALDTLSVTRKVSYPDLATGTARVVINPSGKAPYTARLELIQSNYPGQDYLQDWTGVPLNAQTLDFELTFDHLYSGGYELRVADDVGCEKIYTFTIGTDQTLMVPNIFTPNGDGVNEVFYIRNLPDNTSLIITNRWGKEVYSSSAYTNDWNGGDIVDGVYYYRLGIPGQAITGWVEILRGQ
jgi:gliding motility-associated-like protein